MKRLEYRIETDRYNWTLAEKRIPEKGKQAGEVRWVGVKHFATFPQLVRCLFDDLMRDCYVEGATKSELKELADVVTERAESTIREYEGRIQKAA